MLSFPDGKMGSEISEFSKDGIRGTVESCRLQREYSVQAGGLQKRAKSGLRNSERAGSQDPGREVWAARGIRWPRSIVENLPLV